MSDNPTGRIVDDPTGELFDKALNNQPGDLKPTGVKAPMNLLPAKPLRAVSAAMEYGAIKYEPWNWQDKSNNDERIQELLAALLRHATSYADPCESDYDAESGLHHIAHAGACALLMLHKLGIDYEPCKLKETDNETG